MTAEHVLVTVRIVASWAGEMSIHLIGEGAGREPTTWRVRWRGGRYERVAGEREIDGAIANGLLLELRSIRIPALVDPYMGLDGVTYSLELGDWWGGARYHWWAEAPPGWEPLEAILQRLLALTPLTVEGGP